MGCAELERATRPRDGASSQARTAGTRSQHRPAARARTLAGARRVGLRGRWRLAGGRGRVARRTSAVPCPQDGLEHTHELPRLLTVVVGHASLLWDARAFALRAGDVVVLPAGTPHRLLPHLEQAELLAVDVPLRASLTIAEEPIWERICQGPSVVHFSAAAACEVQSLMHRIRAEQRLERGAGAIAVRAYLMSLLVLLYRRTLRSMPPAGCNTGAEACLRRVAEFMRAHYAEPLRLAELAERAHLSPRQFTTRFKRAFGETPARHLTRLRIGAAQDLLRSPEPSITEIASQVGYESVSHFYRTFVQATGMSPGRYRRLGRVRGAHSTSA